MTESASEKPESPESERSVFALLRDIPGLFMDLIRAEWEQIKREMTRKLKNLGSGALLLFIALSLLSFLFFTLLVAAIFGLATVMPAWAAALVVAGALLLTILILIFAAVSKFKKGNPPLPTESFDSIVEDAHAIKGDDEF